MCFGTNFAAWEADCVRNLVAAEGRPALLLVDRRPNPRKKPGPFWTRLRNLLRMKRKLWTLYERFRVDPRTTSLRRTDLADLLGGVPQRDCEVVRKGKFAEYFQPEDVAAIHEADLDFVLRFAFGIIRGEVLNAPRYGVWSYHHGDEERYRGTPSGFWEIYRSDPKTGVILQRLTDRLDGGVILKKCLFDTIDYSYPLNRDATLYGATHWPVEVCADLRAGNAPYFENPPSKTSAPVTVAPDDGQMIVFTARILWNALRHRLRAG
jgi:hypothetical protein